MGVNVSGSVHESPIKSCVLMFSGGRDSTLSAIRLKELGFSPALVTVSSDHLFGIDAVRQRLIELKTVLPDTTVWLRVRQPKELLRNHRFSSQTCLPCQHAYVVVAAAIANQFGATHVAMGYASYQGGWPEQTPPATELLRAALEDVGISLVLPCYDLTSKQAALERLQHYGIADASLEQKCLQQVNNVTLNDEDLAKELEVWGAALRDTLAKLTSIEIEVMERTSLGDL